MGAACLSTYPVKRPPDIGRFEVKKNQRLSLLTVMIAVIVSGCRTGKNPRPSSTAVEQIPKQATTISAPTSTAGEQNPTLPTATHPILADTQIRLIDGMEMVFVPAGEFVMGSDDSEFQTPQFFIGIFSSRPNHSYSDTRSDRSSKGQMINISVPNGS